MSVESGSRLGPYELTGDEVRSAQQPQRLFALPGVTQLEIVPDGERFFVVTQGTSETDLGINVWLRGE